MLGPKIGEKFLAWTDVDPPLNQILASVTQYQFMETFSRSVYPYCQVSHYLTVCYYTNSCSLCCSSLHQVLQVLMGTSTGTLRNHLVSLGFPRSSRRFRRLESRLQEILYGPVKTSLAVTSLRQKGLRSRRAISKSSQRTCGWCEIFHTSSVREEGKQSMFQFSS